MKTIYETRFAKIGESASHYQQHKITDAEEAKRWAKDCLGEYFADKSNQEEFLIATLNTKNVVQRIVRITRGTLDASLVHPREVFCAAIADCAASIILIHNHPSGDPTPSREDYAITERLKQVGVILGIRVLDHIIVGDTAVSLEDSLCSR